MLISQCFAERENYSHLVGFCVAVWVSFSVFTIFCITSLVSTKQRIQKLIESIIIKSRPIDYYQFSSGRYRLDTPRSKVADLANLYLLCLIFIAE